MIDQDPACPLLVIWSDETSQFDMEWKKKQWLYREAKGGAAKRAYNLSLAVHTMEAL